MRNTAEIFLTEALEDTTPFTRQTCWRGPGADRSNLFKDHLSSNNWSLMLRLKDFITVLLLKRLEESK
jgi:hypothetical protein